MPDGRRPGADAIAAFQHVHSRFSQTLIFDDAQQRIAVVIAQFVVQALLVVAHFAVDRLLQFFGQFAGDALLGTPQDQRTQPICQDLAVSIFSGSAACSLNAELRPSMLGFRNSKIEHRSPKWFSIGVPLRPMR